ncbi:hypothetical protein [Maricaulis sp.]|uniref:hypothetical protein n=1 Tax=Maricaulis sp. TaxID=1486257 RepID=UPI003A921573
MREHVESPPPECLTVPRDLTAMPPGQDWRDKASENGEIARFNRAIAEACQRWWARVEAGRGGEGRAGEGRAAAEP